MAWAQRKIRNGRTTWVGRWRDADGRERSVSRPTRSAALEEARRREGDERDRPDVARQRRTVTVDQWLEVWLTDVVASRVVSGRTAPRTAAGYESNVRNHLTGRWPGLLLTDLTVADVDEMIDDILAQGLSASTAKQVRAVLSSALTHAGRRELVDRNVAQLAEPPELDRTAPSAFDDDELAAILDAAHRHRLGTAIAFGVATGLRRSELCGLQWGDIDLQHLTYQVVRTVHRVGSHAAHVTGQSGLVVSKPKSRSSGDRTTMSDVAADILADQRRRQAADVLASATPTDEQWVWTSTVGTGLEPRQLSRAWDDILADSGVDPIGTTGKARGIHELRRTWWTRTRAAGVPVELAVRLGRWGDAATPLAHYAATPDQALRDAANASSVGINWRSQT